MRASSQQCSEAGDVCAICQAEFRDPVILMCQVGMTLTHLVLKLLGGKQLAVNRCSRHWNNLEQREWGRAD